MDHSYINSTETQLKLLNRKLPTCVINYLKLTIIISYSQGATRNPFCKKINYIISQD